jgi:hypothetical protein
MLGADIIVTQVNTTSNSWSATDMWATGFVRPTVDTQQDAKLVSATRTSAQTAVSVKRPLVGRAFLAGGRKEHGPTAWIARTTQHCLAGAL